MKPSPDSAKPPPARRRAERLSRLQDLLDQGGIMRLREAARLLGVSEMTIRRDLASPEAPLNHFGGYLANPASFAGAAPYVLDREQDSHTQSKQEAGRHAARLVEAGETIFIDCGTTMPHLAASLPREMPLTVVCYSMNVATIVCRRPNLQVVLLGGVYHASSASFYSEEALGILRRIGINKAFLSAGGVHAGRGASCSNFHEVPVKQAALASAAHSHLVVDASKFDRLKPAFFSPLSAFESIITDRSASAASRQRFRQAGARLDIPDPTGVPGDQASPTPRGQI